MIYLDHAATTRVPEEVAKTVYECLTEGYFNPSSRYEAGLATKDALENHRAVIAEALGCKAAELIFTSCGSESDNWAIRAALWQGRHKGKHVITTAIEHSAVLECCKDLQLQGYEVTFLKPDGKGQITAQQVKDALRPDTVLVSMMLVNNETGNILPVQEVATILREENSPALLHCDAVQAFLEVNFTAGELGADFIAVSGHKIGAPKGIGALYVSPRAAKLRPMLFGGGQEAGHRAGTEATAQIAGFAKAVQLRRETLLQDQAHMEELKSYAMEQLSKIDTLCFVGLHQAPHILTFSLPGYPSGNIVNDLSQQGICVSAGSACHKGQPSHVFKAMNLPKKVAAGTIRISFSPKTTQEEIDALCLALRQHKETRFPML